MLKAGKQLRDQGQQPAGGWAVEAGASRQALLHRRTRKTQELETPGASESGTQHRNIENPALQILSVTGRMQ